MTVDRRVLVVLIALSAQGCGVRVAPVIDPVSPLRTEPIPMGRGTLPSDRFGALFCGVLAHLDDQWGFCQHYFAPSGTPAALSDPIPATHRILVVPGIFGECVEAIARPFEDAARHLRAAHGIDVEYVSVSAMGSVPYNAEQIERYLTRQFAGADQRKYIAFGYSKGASDLLEAVSKPGIAREGVAALVTVAGSVLGSRATEGVPRGLVKFLEGTRLGPCSVGDGGGIDDLRRSRRAAAMARFQPADTLHTYSIAAVSDLATTSQVLQNGWRQLQAYSLEQDSQVIHEDAIVPGAVYLGIAKGDHWAVALPFEQMPESDPLAPIILRAVDRNHYPRVALFEAAVRFVADDLASPAR